MTKLWPFGSSKKDTESSAETRELARNLHYEIVPMKSIDGAVEALPPNAHVSVTCSPAKGISATQEQTERLLALGHHATPHVAARLVEGPDHATSAKGLAVPEVQDVQTTPSGEVKMTPPAPTTTHCDPA